MIYERKRGIFLDKGEGLDGVTVLRTTLLIWVGKFQT